MTVSAEVQAQVDQVKSLSDIVQSVDAAMTALKAQVANLQSQVSAVPVASQPSQPGLSQEDKDALTTNISDTQKLIDQLKSDISAGTPQAAQASQGSTPVQPVAPGTDPSTVQPPASTSAAPATQATAPAPMPANPTATPGT